MNKVKYGLSNVHVFPIKEETVDSITYGEVIRIPGAVSLSLSPEGSSEPFYADNTSYYVATSNNGYSGSLEIALIPESFRTDILKETVDVNNVLIENANSETANFAILFEFDGDKHKIRHVMYNCSAARPSLAGQTNEESREVQPETLSLSSLLYIF